MTLPKTHKRKRSENPDPIDIHVGKRLRLRRNLAGLSQEQLALLCGLTFQQIQKYERGINRMGASRLFEFAHILRVPVGYFFEGAPEKPLPTLKYGISDTPQAALDGVPEADTEIMQRRETLELIRTYYRITDVNQRKKIFDLIKSIAEPAKP
jgi:transcriptional regulator with XRE-family HTH domain